MTNIQKSSQGIVLCGECALVIKSENGKIPRECPHCGGVFENKQIRCLGECRGETTLVQTMCSPEPKFCTKCGSRELYEVEGDVSFLPFV